MGGGGGYDYRILWSIHSTLNTKNSPQKGVHGLYSDDRVNDDSRVAFMMRVWLILRTISYSVLRLQITHFVQ